MAQCPSLRLRAVAITAKLTTVDSVFLNLELPRARKDTITNQELPYTQEENP